MKAAEEDLLDRIQRDLLADDAGRVAATLEEALAPQRSYLTPAELAFYGGGKKLRPMLLLLSARMAHGGGRLPDKAVQGAASLEMLHVATLIHDDIVDGALTRRGLESVNARRGTEVALLVGDLQFVQALRGFAGTIDTQSDMGLVKLVLDTAFRICCGELDEVLTDPTQDGQALRDRYLRTIERKTAALFGLACEAGMALGGGRTSDARRAGFYGRSIGVAFQIMDDVFDLVLDPTVSGKPLGMDLACCRLSLPLIHAMAVLGEEHAVTRFLRGVRGAGTDLTAGLEAVRGCGALALAYAEARDHALTALDYLRPFPATPYRAALETIALHIVDRAC